MKEHRNQKVYTVISYCFRVERIYADLHASIEKKSIHVDFDLSKLPLVISRVTALMGLLVRISNLIFTVALIDKTIILSSYSLVSDIWYRHCFIACLIGDTTTRMLASPLFPSK